MRTVFTSLGLITALAHPVQALQVVPRHLPGLEQHIASLERHLPSLEHALLSLEAHLPSLDHSLLALQAHLPSLDHGLLALEAHLPSLEHGLLALEAHLPQLMHGPGTGLVAPMRHLDLELPPAGWDQEDPADSLWLAAREALRRGDAGGAAATYARIRSQAAFARSTYRDDAYYWEAYARHRLGSTAQLREAERLLVELRRLYPRFEGMAEVANLQARVASALAQNGSPNANMQVNAMVADVTNQQCPAHDEQMAAIEALIGMPPEAVAPLLRRVMARRDSCSAPLREHAVFLITRLNTPEAEAMMLEAARNDPSPKVRQHAVFWLSRVNSELAVELIEEILRTSTDKAMLENAVHALSQQQSPRASQLLRDLAGRTAAPPEVRVAAIHFLGMRGNDDTAAFVRNLWPSLNTEELKEAALFALSRRRGAGNEEFLLGIVNNEREPMNVRTMALHWVGQSQSLNAARLGELYDGAAAVQMKEQILHSLSRLPDNGGLDQMIRIARAERNVELKKMAIHWIGRSNDPRAVRFISEIIGG